MSNLKEIRNRISSVSSTRQITSAMKMVSAAKLRRAQDAILQMRPYADKLYDILKSISNSLENEADNVFGQERQVNNVLIVLITSNRGLCGAFNSQAIKLAVELAKVKYAKQLARGNVYFMAFGKKGCDFLRAGQYKLVESHNEIFDNLTFENVAPVATEIMESFSRGQYDRIELVYNQFKNAAVQILTQEQYLPVKVDDEGDDFVGYGFDYIYEPNMEVMINELIPRSLKIQLYKALLDSHAAEFGARMTAMHKATDNATELIKDLRLTYNKARQASITNEILEIVGGAEALNK